MRLLKTEGYENVLTLDHHLIDLCIQYQMMDYFVSIRPDYVFHLAAHVGGIHDNTMKPVDFCYNNTVMQCNVLEACHRIGVKKLLFPGSACAYPRDAEQPIKESSFLQGMPEPTNLAYAVAKINGIIMAQSYAKQYGMNVVLPIVTNAYGVGDRSSHVIPDLVKNLRSVKDPLTTIWGTGNCIREFIYADDVASAFLFLMRNYNSLDIINVGTMEEVSIYELVSIILPKIKKDISSISFDPSRLEGIYRKCLDSSKLYAMGWKPKVSLEEGLRRVIAS